MKYFKDNANNVYAYSVDGSQDEFISSDFVSISEEEAKLLSKQPELIPQSVTMRQARLALLRANLLDSVEASILAIPDTVQQKAAKIEWEYAQTVDRDSSFTQQLAAGLGLTSVQLDALFLEASQL